MANPPGSETFRSIATISSKRWPNFKERVWNLQTRLPTEVLDSLPISKCQAISTCSYINRGTRKPRIHATASGKQIPFMQQWGIASAARSRCDACI